MNFVRINFLDIFLMFPWSDISETSALQDSRVHTESFNFESIPVPRERKLGNIHSDK
jgi:hypothetical protein